MIPQGAAAQADLPRLHGLKLSYFTGKLEAYFRVKGIEHVFVEMDTADFRRCARASGVAQMPQVELPDGAWLTDTTAIIAHFENTLPHTPIRPTHQAIAFASLLLEDFFDEWLWRPALYYRWAFAQDARLMSAQIARTMLRDLPLPFWVRRQFILARQKRVYLRDDGLNPRTAPQAAALYLTLLDMLEPVFSARPFLLGARPCEADFGLFGSMFRHFFSDPTPGAIMRERAPAVAHWVTRLWATRPGDIAHAPSPAALPGDLAPLWNMVSTQYLPYLSANAQAVMANARFVSYTIGGVEWRVPASPYRAYCLAELQRRYLLLAVPFRDQIAALLGEGGAIFNQAPQALAPPSRHPTQAPLDRQWNGRRRA
jgi:glutathione S-transferase